MSRQATLMITVTLSLSLVLVNGTGCKKKQVSIGAIKVIAAIGDVSLNSPDRMLKTNDTISVGDKIITGNNSLVELFIPEKSGIKIYENSEFFVRIKDTDHQGHIKKSSYLINEGKALFVIDKIVKDNDLTVYTPTAVASVRGTTFVVEVKKGGKDKKGTKLQVVNGKVSVQSKDKPEEDIIVEDGEKITVTEDAQAEKDKTNIDEAELEKLNKEEEKLKEKIVINTQNVNIKAEKVIINTGKQTPDLKSEEAIKQYYNKLEEINLDDGTRLIGAVIFQNESIVKIHTTSGIIQVPTSSIRNIRIR